MNYMLLTLAFLTLAVNAEATVHTKAIEYRQGDAILEGYLAWDDHYYLKRPGILVIHEWTGITPYIKHRAEMLAKLGYVAFAADIYGKCVRPATVAEAAKTAAIYKDNRALMRARARAGLEVLKKQKNVDPKLIAVIGYCFGGTVALELARDGADVAGTVSFHGGLATPTPQDAKNIKGKVLALAGADDPYVKQDEVNAFEDEMRTGGVDWQLNVYGNAVHGFTNPDNGNDNSRGVAYNKEADRRSWAAMKAFLAEVIN